MTQESHRGLDESEQATAERNGSADTSRGGCQLQGPMEDSERASASGSGLLSPDDRNCPGPPKRTLTPEDRLAQNDYAGPAAPERA